MMNSPRTMSAVVCYFFATLLATLLPAQQLDETWTLTVRGQAVTANPDGTFRIPNISASDQFGPAGPGSAPDFLSDDLVQIVGVSTADGVTTYAVSEPFRIRQGEVFGVPPLTISGDPPPIPVSIRLTLDQVVLIGGGQSLAQVDARLADDSIIDVSSPRDGTTYRTSNPAVAIVDETGVVTGVDNGIAFITATNRGATAVRRIDVTDTESLTRVAGFAIRPDGTPVVGAVATVFGQQSSAVTGSDGSFLIDDVITTDSKLRVRAILRSPGENLSGTSEPFEGVPGGISDAGFLTMDTPTSSGTDFVVCFPRNYDTTPELELFVASDVQTSGQVEIPGLGFAESFTVSPGQVTTLSIPPGASLSARDGVEPKGVLLRTDSEVCVYGINRINFSTDAFSALPVDTLGTRYRVVSQPGQDARSASILAVAASDDDTEVTITPRVTIGSHPAGTPFLVQLAAGEVYQLEASSADVTGTLIESNLPVAVFSAHGCANVPLGVGFCDHLIEQVPPTETWGLEVLTVSLASRSNGDFFRIVADEDQTSVQIEGTNPRSVTLDAGGFLELNLGDTGRIRADRPIMVAQFATGSRFGGNPGDPMMMLLPPAQQFQSRYLFTTPSTGFSSNFVNIVAPSAVAMAGGVDLDGVAVPASEFSGIPGAAWMAARRPIALGSHVVSASEPIGIYVYGFNRDDSYGYPGGMALTAR